MNIPFQFSRFVVFLYPMCCQSLVCMQVEDISDEVFAERHMRSEILEKKKFCTFQNNQRRRNRHDSSASGLSSSAPAAALGMDLVEPPLIPVGSHPSLSSLAMDQSDSTASLTSLGVNHAGSSASLTSLAEDDGGVGTAMRGRSGSCSSRTADDEMVPRGGARAEELREEARSTTGGAAAINNRRRTGSLSNSQNSGTPAQARGRGRSQSVCDVETVYEVTYNPWEERCFPLDDTGFANLYKESPYGENAYVPRQTRRNSVVEGTSQVGTISRVVTGGVRVEGLPGTPQNSRPCSPAQSSSSSTIIEEDPNDPEWTIVTETEAKSERKPSIVLKLAKR